MSLLQKLLETGKKKKKALGIGAGVLLVAALGLGAGLPAVNRVRSAQATAAAPAAVQTSVVGRSDLRISTSGSGKLVAGREFDLSFSTGGAVIALNVSLGDEVKEGQELAQLDRSDELEAKVAKAELAYLQTKQALDELYRKADVSLAEAYQAWVQAKYDYEDAQAEAERSGLARCSEQVRVKYGTALDKARARVSELEDDYGSDAWVDAQNVYDNALANYTYCASYTTDEKDTANAEVDIAKNTLAEAEAKYKSMQNAAGLDPDEVNLAKTELTLAEANLKAAKADLAGITLVAPIAGKITAIEAGQGEVVDTDSFLTISDMTRPMLDVSIDEADLDKLVIGNAAEVVFDALPDEVFTGKVAQVDPELTAQGQYRIATCVVELDKSAVERLSTLPLGLNATVEIIAKEVKGALTVPVEALRDLGDGQYAVFVRNSAGKLRLKVVEVGIQGESYVEILSGVQEGDVVSTGVMQTSTEE